MESPSKKIKTEHKVTNELKRNHLNDLVSRLMSSMKSSIYKFSIWGSRTDKFDATRKWNQVLQHIMETIVYPYMVNYLVDEECTIDNAETFVEFIRKELKLDGLVDKQWEKSFTDIKEKERLESTGATDTAVREPAFEILLGLIAHFFDIKDQSPIEPGCLVEFDENGDGNDDYPIAPKTPKLKGRLEQKLFNNKYAIRIESTIYFLKEDEFKVVEKTSLQHKSCRNDDDLFTKQIAKWKHMEFMWSTPHKIKDPNVSDGLGDLMDNLYWEYLENLLVAPNVLMLLNMTWDKSTFDKFVKTRLSRLSGDPTFNEKIINKVLTEVGKAIEFALQELKTFKCWV